MTAKKNILNQKNKEKLNFLMNHIQKTDNQEPELALLTKKAKRGGGGRFNVGTVQEELKDGGKEAVD